MPKNCIIYDSWHVWKYSRSICSSLDCLYKNKQGGAQWRRNRAPGPLGLDNFSWPNEFLSLYGLWTPVATQHWPRAKSSPLTHHAPAQSEEQLHSHVCAAHALAHYIDDPSVAIFGCENGKKMIRNHSVGTHTKKRCVGSVCIYTAETSSYLKR